MESLPVILIITNRECGHCTRMRGNGSLKKTSKTDTPTINNKYHWDVDFFKKLISGNQNDGVQRFRVYDVYLKEMRSSSTKDIIEFCEFRIVGNKVIRYCAKILNNKLSFTKDSDTTLNAKGTSAEFEGVFNKKVNLLDISNSKIPDGIIPNFLAYFPMFLFFDGYIWNKSLNKEQNIFGYIPGTKLKLKDDGKYEIDREIKPHPTDDYLINSERFSLTGSDYDLLTPKEEESREIKHVSFEEPAVVSVDTQHNTQHDTHYKCIKLPYRIVSK